ncbi:hypothetical protein, conserved [Eimeria brunetti]|uniref:Thioredoxin domain-containing protein n=1 Tax=Eimeria brunetti TaxID=51314 RepID=U6LBJ4_9EIME|nr:hypothetical protein, conserved [Eimeria brunetti]
MGSVLQHPLQRLTGNNPSPAAIRFSRCFNSPSAAASGNSNSSNMRSNSKGEHEGSSSSATVPDIPFTRVTDSSSHWLPSLARAKERQGGSFRRLSAAAKGDCTSADVETVEQRALAAVKKEGWSVPGTAVVLFSAQWSEPSRALQQWLSTRLSALSPFVCLKRKKAEAAELVVLSSEEAPRLLRVFGVAALPHCLLLRNGRVACELPAGASAARQEAFVAEVSSAVSAAGEREKQNALLHKLKEDLLLSARTSEPDKQPKTQRRTFRMRRLTGDSARQSSWKSGSNDGYQAASPAGYLLDSDDRTAQLTALATVALFDVPDVTTPDLQALHEVLSWAMQSRRSSSPNKKQKEAPPVPAGICGTLEKILEREEPQWAPDDCPIIRRLPLYNQLLLNKRLFAKAPGAQPLLSPRASLATPGTVTDAGAEVPAATTGETTGTSFSDECFKIETWRLAEWLARTRRCLSARLFLDKAEASGLELAMTTHAEWLEDAALCNYMQINVAGYPEKMLGEGTGVGTMPDKLKTLRNTEGNRRRGVHPFNVWFEPRAPSAGRTLLTCMYTALGE